MTPIHAITHPDYDYSELNWRKWRLTYAGGDLFVRTYLKKFGKREDIQDYNDRLEMTYCPRFAGAAVDDVKNSIYQRMADIKREDGTPSYMQAVDGFGGGVDLKGSSMNVFVGCEVLPELLSMGKVGVFVDMPPLNGVTLAHNANKRPYLYLYRVEDIRCWSHYETDPTNKLQSVLLRDHNLVYDEETKLPTDIKESYRLLWEEGGKVYVRFFDHLGDETDAETIVLDIPRIPFVPINLSNSLLKDIADYQITLLNLSSSDVAFALKANFPFYTEQYDALTDNMRFLRSAAEGMLDEDSGFTDKDTQGIASEASKSSDNEIKVGVTHGRRYPKDTDRPQFIHPSPEPMMASMQKQEQLKQEIRLLLNLALSNMRPMKASAESKATDDRSLEAGLSYIGLTLQNAERQIADIWSSYERSDKQALIKYPTKYSLKSEKDRQDEVETLFKQMEKIPSSSFQKSIAKKAAGLLLEHNTKREDLDKVYKEIDTAPNMTADPEVIRADVESGLVSKELASSLRGYPSGEADKAKKEHVERLEAIAKSQSDARNMGAARGVDDMGADATEGKQEKAESRERDDRNDDKDNTRGKGRDLNVAESKTGG